MLTLTITEINFNPYDSMPDLGESEDVDNDKYEFIELMNNSETESLNLSSFALRKTIDNQGVDFEFSAINLEPMDRIVVVDNTAAFVTRYGSDVKRAGQWSGSLSNDREVISLYRNNVLVEQVEYKSTSKWPTRPDGLGASLERKDFEAPDLSDPDVWRSSVEYGGSPGQAPRANRDSPIIINEALAHTDIENNGQMDAIELRNITDEPVDVSGWYLTDDVVEKTLVFSIPNNIVIPAGGYQVFTEADFNPNMMGFALSEAGEPADPDNEQGGLWLLEGGADGRPTAFADRVTFGPTFNGVSIGNVSDVDQSSHLLQLDSLTFGRTNGGHRVGEVVINEVQYHPADDDLNKEFIELQSGPFAVDLSGWQIADAVDIVFPEGTTMAPNTSLVLVAFDPTLAPETASIFRSYYGIDANVDLMPWGADEEGNPDRLNNNGEVITLAKPEFDQELGTLFVTIDQVDFSDSYSELEPWPEVADGDGGSIQRLTPDLYGNFADSWEGITPTPGNQPFDLSKNPEIVLDTPISANIGKDGEFIRGAADVDLYRFTPSESQDYTFNISADVLTGAEAMLRVFSEDGTELAMKSCEREIQGQMENCVSKSIELTVPLTTGQEYIVGVNGNSDHAANYDPLTGKGIAAGNLPGTYNLSVSATGVVLPPWQNPILAEDVNGIQGVAPIDALLVINWLNENPSGVLPDPSDEAPPPYLDVNGDGSVSPIDALMVINYLNAEAVPAAVAATPIDLLVNARLDSTSASDANLKERHLETAVAQSVDPTPPAVDLLFGAGDDDSPRQPERKSSALDPLDLAVADLL